MSTVTLRLDVAEWLRAAAGAAGPATAAAVQQVLSTLEAAGMPTDLTVTVPIPVVPGSAATGPAPVDPREALLAMATAVALGEDALNARGLAISGGTMETSLVSAVDGLPGARTRISLSLTPRSQP